MEKILLAIDGLAPDNRIFNYALSLCKRMRAGLEILQILGPQSCKKYLKKVKQSARHTSGLFEDAMVAATFAEAGQPEMAEQLRNRAFEKLNRLIPKGEKDNIEYHLTLKSGNPDEEIVRYVNDHRNVILTIYNPAAATDQPEHASGANKDTVRQISKKLSTPLVVIREM